MLTSKKRSQSSSGMSKKSFGSKMPALLTRISTSGTAASSALQPAAVETSAAMPRTLPPGTAFAIAATAASTLAWPRPLMMTSAPVPARPLAIALPMPAVEPVTSAVFPERSIFIGRSPVCRAADICVLARCRKPDAGTTDSQKTAPEGAAFETLARGELTPPRLPSPASGRSPGPWRRHRDRRTRSRPSPRCRRSGSRP